MTPASDFARIFGEDPLKHLVIINLQRTPLDRKATIRINSKCDDAMELVFKKLNLKIPQWRLQRNIIINYNDDNKKLNMKAIDVKMDSMYSV